LAAFISPVSAALVARSFLLVIRRGGTAFFEILGHRRPLWVSAQAGIGRGSGVLELGLLRERSMLTVGQWRQCPGLHAWALAWIPMAAPARGRGRLGVAGSIVARLDGVWRRRGLSLSAKLGVYTSLVQSVVLCGSEAWTVRRVDGGGVRSFHMRALRRVLGVGWCDRVPGAVVGGGAGLPDVPSLVAGGRRSLFGHICRLPESAPASRALRLSVGARAGTPPAAGWGRPPGRPRRDWLQQLEEDTGLSVGAAWIAGQDRSMWRTLRPSVGQAQQ